MEEDDHDELLQVTDDDSISDVDDNCLPSETHEDETPKYKSFYLKHTKYEFLLAKLFLILSSTCMLILLPPYLDSINIKSDAYNSIVMITTLTIIVLVALIICGKLILKKYKDVNFFSIPMSFSKMLLLSAIFFISGSIILYSSDQKRVLCHLQDPIKGIVLVFSLLFYFIFCKKMMGLQRIFSATTIIVGLFIAVDYGLCDEFRCRGYERIHVSDDTGNWPWKVHATWLIIYIVGLALFSGYFTLLDHFILNREENVFSINIGSSFLSTVSRSVSYTSDTNLYVNQNVQTTNVSKKKSAVHILLWMHIFGLIFIVAPLAPFIKQGSSVSFMKLMSNGFYCHFKPELTLDKNLGDCGYVFVLFWPFLVSYVLFSISSIKFLMMCQSAVYTVATMCTSLPIVGIWWSLFHLVPLQNGGSFMLWSPSVTGELICSLIGLPIVLVGLSLLCKFHFKDYHWFSLTSTHVPLPRQFA